MKSWFLSDLHLDNSFERNGNTLLRFLFELNEKPSEHRLFLLGDIFDVWISDGSVFTKKFDLIIKEIIKLKKNGGEVYYFEGNHDVHIEKFWSLRHQIPVYTKEKIFELDGLKVRIEHGDYINPDDTAYLKWLEILRHPIMRFFAHLLPSRLWYWNAKKYSKKSRKKTSRYSLKNSEHIRELIRTYAKSKYQEQDFDLIVTGHMHVFDDFEFKLNEKKVRSINLGTWLEKPRVLKIENNQIQIQEL